jgi:hypothetical protein
LKTTLFIEMPTINIPERNFIGIKLLLELSEQESEILRQQLEKIPPCLTKADILDNLKVNLEDFNKQTIDDIVDFLLSANDFRIHQNLTKNEIIESISSFVVTKKLSELPEGYDLDFVKSRLSVYLGVEGQISLISKIRSIYSEHQKIYSSSRVFTEVRPVFDENIESIPAAIILHNLKVNYMEDNVSKSFSIVLDDSDIDTLISSLERAKRKRELIKTSLNKAKLVFVEQN